MWDNLLESNHKKPIFKVTVIKKEQEDITTLLSDRLINLTIDDNRGFEADELTIELSDHDGKLAFPARNVLLEVAIGWQDEELVNKGRYVVDELSYSGSPDKLTIRARSADLRGSLSTKQERSWHNIRLGKLIEQIAQENKLTAKCDPSYSEQLIPHIDQTDESPISFLSRLAEQYDAIATVKNGNLLFIPTAGAKSANGKALPTIEIRKNIGDSYQFSLNESDNYKAVRAYWHNFDNGKKGEVIIDENSKVVRQSRITKTGKVSKQKQNVLIQHKPITADTEQIKTIRHVYKYEGQAINGAKAMFDKLQRGIATFSIQLALGNPELMPERPATLSGFKDEIDSTDWIISKVSHQLSNSGFTSSVELELRLVEDKGESEEQ